MWLLYQVKIVLLAGLLCSLVLTENQTLAILQASSTPAPVNGLHASRFYSMLVYASLKFHVEVMPDFLVLVWVLSRQRVSFVCQNGGDSVYVNVSELDIITDNV